MKWIKQQQQLWRAQKIPTKWYFKDIFCQQIKTHCTLEVQQVHLRMTRWTVHICIDHFFLVYNSLISHFFVFRTTHLSGNEIHCKLFFVCLHISFLLNWTHSPRTNYNDCVHPELLNFATFESDKKKMSKRRLSWNSTNDRFLWNYI